MTFRFKMRLDNEVPKQGKATGKHVNLILNLLDKIQFTCCA
jgi:hypothetical protein